MPEEGVKICGRFFKKGTIVGMSPYVTNRNRQTWGEDANEWRPERWLGLGVEERKMLDQSLLTVSFRTILLQRGMGRYD